jgi:hypothetical protein
VCGAQLLDGPGNAVGVGDVGMQRDCLPTLVANLGRDGIDLRGRPPEAAHATPRPRAESPSRGRSRSLHP